MTEVARDPRAAGSGRYTSVAILLHWLIAAAVVAQIILAGRMEGRLTPTSFAVIQLHKSIGITILLLSFVRLGWRLANPPPPLVATMAGWERNLARVVHVGLYAAMIGLPLTGWIMVSASRFDLPFLLFGVVPWANLPGLQDLAPETKELWHELGEEGHELLVKGLFLLLALHVGGALKHQLFSRDEPVLARMAPGAVAGRWREPRLLLIVLGFAAVIAAARFAPPPDPGFSLPPSAYAPPSGELQGEAPEH